MAQTPPSQQQFCVRWNSHLGSLGAAFPQLLAGQRFVDVTLACEGHQLHCHRLVLAACSAYFESLLSENPCKHPIIIMPHDIKLWEIQALVDFMYKGEVNVSQAGLPDLLKCAEVLQIRGLCGSDAALNLNSIVRTKEYTVPSTVSVQPHLITATVTSASPPCSTTTTSTVSTLASVSANNGNNVNNVQTLPKPSPNEPNSPRETCTSPNIQNSGTASAQNNSIKRSPPVYEPNTSQVIKAAGQPSKFATSTPNNSVAPKVEPVDEMMEEYTDEETIGMSAKGEREESEYLDGSSKQSTDFALANVICQYDGGLQINMDNVPSRRVRRSEAILRQAAECVSKGQTFQTVSDMFNIPISTIRFFMARKGILPRRKRGRAAGVSIIGSEFHNNSSMDNRSASPSEPPFHFANYKLPDIKPKLL